MTSGRAQYVAFRQRAIRRTAVLASLREVDEPGVTGAIAVDGPPRGGLLVLEPDALAALMRVLEEGTPQWVGLLAPDPELLAALAREGWDLAQEHRVMSLSDLADLQPAPLPEGVTVADVAVGPDGPGFPLVDALRVELEHGPAGEAAPMRDIALEAQLLRALPGIRFLAALAADGICVGTAGSRVVDGSALVAGVATVTEFRRRGLATAMTRLAVEAARDDGATMAFLDSTPEGVGIYRRLGFTDLGPIVYCERSTPARR